jgi:adenylate kinase
VTTLATTDPAARVRGGRRIIVMIGAPGAGKGTQAERLAATLGLPHISTGELFREAVGSDDALGAKVRRYVGSGALVPDDIVVEVVGNRLSQPDAAGGAILDGFPRTVAQARALDGMLARQGTAVCAALYVEVSADLLLERLTGRRVCSADDQHVYHVTARPPLREGVCDICGSELYQREDDAADTVRARLDAQLPPMYEVIDHYADAGVLFPVRGDRGAEEVTADLLHALATINAPATISASA